MKQKNKKTVLMAMSGGVDSSVAAALLKKQGYQVVGAFMHFWIDPGSARQGIENKCCSGEAERIACRVAGKLEIPFYVFHFEKEFKKAVVDYFLEEFKQGRTPNPCVVCNKEIKFGLFFKKALELGLDYLATGHYIRLRRDNSRHKLFKAKDKTKDQSYFLWTLGQKQISRLLFPLSDYTKKQVYDLAKKWDLPYRKAESFDICFIAGREHNEFLKKHLKMKPGPIVDKTEKIIGQHEGLPLYTIGQRKEIGIGATGPYYVIRADTKTNTLFVTNKPYDRQLYKKTLVAGDVNWISGTEPKLPLKCQARIRYGHKAVPAQITKHEVLFSHSQRAVTPGQSVVFYQRNEMLGGGVIASYNT